MALTKSFSYLTKGTTQWQPSPDETTEANGHALVVIGYDDATQTVELMNSWGTDWADNGFVRISYANFIKYVMETYCFELKKQAIEVKIVGLNYGKPTQTGIDIAYNATNHRYYFSKTTPSDSRYFQIQTAAAMDLHYYILMLSDESSLLKGELEAEKNKQLPDENQAFQREDEAILLFSAQPIADFSERNSLFKNTKGSLKDKVQTAFGDVSIDEKSIIFDNNQLILPSQKAGSKQVVAAIYLKFATE